MKKHVLKSDPLCFAELWASKRNVETRLNDRGFKGGDKFLIVETRYSGKDMKAGQPLEYTGRAILGHIRFVHDDLPGIKARYCILDLVPEDSHKDINRVWPNWTEWANEQRR